MFVGKQSVSFAAIRLPAGTSNEAGLPQAATATDKLKSLNTENTKTVNVALLQVIEGTEGAEKKLTILLPAVMAGRG